MKLTFPLALGLLFIGLKLTGYIAWSWWLVLLPLYAWVEICLVVVIVMTFLAGVVSVWQVHDQRKKAEHRIELERRRR